MYLLAATLVVGNAFAFPELNMPIGGCFGMPAPCTRLATGDASIVPSDWIELVTRNLDGNLNWFRVEVPLDLGSYDVEIAGIHLDERWQSREESSTSLGVYYVPATREAKVYVKGGGQEGSDFWIVLDGVEKPVF